MISNRQNRRRGRGSSRGGNRPSTPSKGNAAQLLEKYKGLARDAQMSGDRVQQEYYLQFADHYFRVLEEYNSKQSDQQQQRSSRHRSNDDDDDTDDQPQQQDQQQDKPKRSTRSTRAKRDDARDEKPSDKPKRSRKPKSDDNAGEGIADALPPAIGNAEDEAA